MPECAAERLSYEKDRLQRQLWPASEQPRERLLAHGPAVLTDAELLALLLGSGSPRAGGALTLGRRLLARVGGLAGLGRSRAQELMAAPGIGAAKGCALAAAVELGRRLAVAEAGAERPQLHCSQQAFRALFPRLQGQRQELFLVVALDARARAEAVIEVGRGSAVAVDVHPREVFGPLVRQSCVSAIVAHNHPSGDPEPSADDIALTGRLVEVGMLLGIPLLDHLIIAGKGYVSLADRGLLI